MGVRVSGGPTDAPFAMGQTRDISLHGLYVELKMLSDPSRSFAVKDRLHLRFRPPNADFPLDVAVKVTRTIKNSDGQVIGLGVEFQELGEREQTAIRAFVESQLDDFDVRDS